MRSVVSALGIGAALLLTGCNGSRWGFLGNQSPQAAVPREVPSAEAVVDHLNSNARFLQTVKVGQLDLDCKYRGQAFGLRGEMICQKPKNFRMYAAVLGRQEVDLGSNESEFWYWIGKADPPYLYHCSYEDFQRGVRLPFPFQPEWIMEALGMAEYPPGQNYQLIPRAQTLELVQQTTSTQGQPMRKVTVLNRAKAQGQVRALVLQDAQGREVCSAMIQQHQRVGDVILPRVVVLSWPTEQTSLRLTLDEVAVNQQVTPEMAARLFSRPRMANVQSYDLARGLEVPGSHVERAGAFATPQR